MGGIVIILIPLLFMIVIWPYIADLFARVVIPFIRKTLGNTIAEPVATLLTWVDRPASVARAKVMSGWRFFRANVLGIKTTYRKTSATTALEKTETWLLHPSKPGLVNHQAEEREIAYEDLPQEIRNQMNRQNITSGVLDIKAVFEKQVQEQAQKEDLVLETSA
jgi:hypothetical protein